MRTDDLRKELRVFHRIFLYVPEDQRFRFRLRLCPDAEQPGAFRGPTAIISAVNDEPLGLCLRELGVTGYSRYCDETAYGPRFEYSERSPDEIIASLRTQPLSSVAQVTLVATEAPSDMLALKPYWGKPAVRDFRGDDGNVGIIRSPVRAIVLLDRQTPAQRQAWIETRN